MTVEPATKVVGPVFVCVVKSEAVEIAVAVSSRVEVVALVDWI